LLVASMLSRVLISAEPTTVLSLLRRTKRGKE
jgi:hypothetical protein